MEEIKELINEYLDKCDIDQLNDVLNYVSYQFETDEDSSENSLEFSVESLEEEEKEVLLNKIKNTSLPKLS